MWEPYQNGTTLNTTGSEGGCILRDDEHPAGARITLEQGGFTPFGITCGIYGSFVHTAFAGTEDEATAKYQAMKVRLEWLLDHEDELQDELRRFVDDF